MAKGNEIELKFKLLKTIGQFYPIGLPISTSQYNGYQELKRIVENKINTLIEKKTIYPWDTLVNSLKESFPENKVHNWNFRDYPSMSATIELNRFSDERISRITSIEVFISLLGPYFTVALSEEFIDSVRIENQSPRNFAWAFVSTTETEEKQLNLIKEIIHRHYPEYEFVNCFLLLRTIIFGGIPHGIDIETACFENPSFKYPMFNYLFGPGNSFVV